jgi:hypothetical protein
VHEEVFKLVCLGVINTGGSSSATILLYLFKIVSRSREVYNFLFSF